MKRLLWLLVSLMVLTVPVFAIGENTPIPPAPSPIPTLAPQQPTAVPDAPTDDITAAFDKANQQLSDGKYGDAVETLSVLIKKHPDLPQAYYWRGFAYQSLARYSLALDDYTLAISLVPYNWEFYAARADVYILSDELGEAVFDYNTAIDLNPRYYDGYYRRSQLQSALSKPDESEMDYLMAQGLSSGAIGDYEGAIANLSDAIDKAGNNRQFKAYALYNRALIYFEMGDLDKAFSDCNAASEYFSDMHDIYLLRGTIYVGQGKLQDAGRDYYRRITLLQEQHTDSAYNGSSTVVPMDYGQTFTFTFDATAGDVYTFSATDTDNSGVDALIAILDPSGNAIAGDDDSGVGVQGLDALVANWRVPTTGTYTLVVSHANGGYVGNLAVEITPKN